jgi:micrococcal nuclease
VLLSGIDTPETKKPGYSVGCGGPEATQFAQDTLVGRRVSIITDSSQDIHDRYGRTLAYVDRADGWDYSIESARAGVVRDYVYENHPAQRYPQIAAAEQDAKQAGRGLRGPPCFGHTESIPT